MAPARAQVSCSAATARSADAPSERDRVRSYACGVHSVITATLSTGGAHVNAATGLVADDPDDDIVDEAKPTILLTRPDAPASASQAAMVQPGIDFATCRASLNALVTDSATASFTWLACPSNVRRCR